MITNITIPLRAGAASFKRLLDSAAQAKLRDSPQVVSSNDEAMVPRYVTEVHAYTGVGDASADRSRDPSAGGCVAHEHLLLATNGEPGGPECSTRPAGV